MSLLTGEEPENWTTQKKYTDKKQKARYMVIGRELHVRMQRGDREFGPS